MCLVTTAVIRGLLGPLELQTVVSCYTGIWNRTWVLCNSSKYSLALLTTEQQSSGHNNFKSVHDSFSWHNQSSN